LNPVFRRQQYQLIRYAQKWRRKSQIFAQLAAEYGCLPTLRFGHH
jgi:hypothetical protein